MDVGCFSSLVGALYDAALDPASWAALASTFAQAFDAESCAVQSIDVANQTAGLVAQTANFDMKAIESYEAYYHKTDILARRMAKLGTGRAMLSAEVTGQAELLDSEIFNEYGRRLGIFWALGSVIPVEGSCLGAIGIHRPYEVQNFDEADKRCLSLLLPHLSRAMLLQRRLDGLTRDRRIALEALEKLATGVIAVDASAKVLFANGTAEQLLRAGLGLAVRDGHLRATQPDRADDLTRLIRQAARAEPTCPTEAGGWLALPRRQRRPLSLLVCPLPSEALIIGPSASTAMIFLGDPDAVEPTSQRALARLYGLTPAEARLMAAIVDGERLEQYAERRGISINTAKAQSKQIFAKTGHGRQADLLRDVLTNPAVRAKIISR